MKISQLAYFYTAVKMKHITEAAQALNLTQPALTSTIRRMEEELGVQLLEPAGRNVRITPAGEIVYRRAQEILHAWDRMEHDLGCLSVKQENAVEIICPPDILSPGLMENILAKNQNVTLNISSPLSAEAYRRFDAGEIDLIINHPMYTGKNVESLVLEPDKMVIIASDKTWRSAATRVAIQDLAEERFAAYRKGVPLRQEFEELCRKRGFSANIVFEANSIKEMLPVILAGRLFAYAPLRVLSYMHSADLEALRVLEITDIESIPNIGISWLRDRPLRPAVEAVRQCVICYFNAQTGL